MTISFVQSFPMSLNDDDDWNSIFPLFTVTRERAGIMDTTSRFTYFNCWNVHLHDWPAFHNDTSQRDRRMDAANQICSKARCWFIWLSNLDTAHQELCSSTESRWWVWNGIKSDAFGEMAKKLEDKVVHFAAWKLRQRKHCLLRSSWCDEKSLNRSFCCAVTNRRCRAKQFPWLKVKSAAERCL